MHSKKPSKLQSIFIDLSFFKTQNTTQVFFQLNDNVCFHGSYIVYFFGIPNVFLVNFSFRIGVGQICGFFGGKIEEWSWKSEKKCHTNRELDTKVALKIYSVSVEVHLSVINQLAPAEPAPPTQNHPRRGKVGKCVRLLG